MERFALNLVCRLAYLAGISSVNLVEFGLEISELHRCENHVLFLPVNILTVWRTLASWAARHTTVSLDYIVLVNNCRLIKSKHEAAKYM